MRCALAQGEGCSVDRDAAQRLAEGLRSSLTRGLASDAGELARRAEALGSNSLPDRDQARAPAGPPCSGGALALYQVRHADLI